MVEPQLGPTLMHSQKLELVGYLDSDAIVASKSKIRCFILERLKTTEGGGDS